MDTLFGAEKNLEEIRNARRERMNRQNKKRLQAISDAIKDLSRVIPCISADELEYLTKQVILDLAIEFIRHFKRMLRCEQIITPTGSRPLDIPDFRETVVKHLGTLHRRNCVFYRPRAPISTAPAPRAQTPPANVFWATLPPHIIRPQPVLPPNFTWLTPQELIESKLQPAAVFGIPIFHEFWQSLWQETQHPEIFVQI